MATLFLHCLRMIEAGVLEDAERCIARREWREGADLTGVPPQILDETERLSARALSLMKYGHHDAIREAVTRIVDLWA